MGQNTVADKTINQLKSKLDSAINARSELEEEFSAQSALLTTFIGKLSQACKGTDMLLDNKLANLRSSLKKSVTFVELEIQINAISALLQQHSVMNDKNVQKLHERLQDYGSYLQKSKDLPKENRQQLRKLVTTTKQSKDSLVQYVPIMSEFIDFYELLLKNKSNQPTAGLLNNNKISLDKINKVSAEENSVTGEEPVSKELLEHFSHVLNNLIVSAKHKKQLSQIKQSISTTSSNQALVNTCFKVFDLIIDDLQLERSTAKIFLSTLSDTLATVQASVSSTIASTSDSSKTHDKLNAELKQKIDEMSVDVNDASSLADMKNDVNLKLKQIATTLEKKTKLEEQERQALKDKLATMSEQVQQLEQQSQNFEKRIQEQQEKNFQDALTKLCNRAAFDEHFAKELVRFHHDTFDLAIAVIDLDDFKRINDTYGHTAGDKTLQVIAKALTKVVGKDAFVARYGGEEFVIVFSNIAKPAILKKLDLLRQRVANLPFTFKNNRVNITLSIGVTLIRQEDNVHSAFERADTALYQAKKDGKNKVIYG